MHLRRPTRYEAISIVVFLALCVGSVWYLAPASNMIGDVEMGFHGQLARALGIGIAVVLALVLNIAFIILARKQTAMEEAEEASDDAQPHSGNPRGLE